MDYICKSVVAQRCGYELDACSVYGCVDDFEVVMALDDFRVQREALDGGQEGFIDVSSDVLYQFGIAFELDVAYIGDFVDVVDDVDIMWGKYLCTIGPVSLVSVVFFGIMRCGNVDAALASEMKYGEGQLGGWLDGLERISLDAEGREDVAAGLGKVFGVVTHIVAYDNRNLRQVGKSLFEVVGQTLCGSSYGIDVHAIGARAHDAAQTACPKF